MWIDKGREFYNKDARELVEIHSTENKENFCVIERFNCTIKDKILKYFTANSTRKYIDVLENEKKVFGNLYPDFGDKTPTQKFSVGDNIRINKKENLIEKDFIPR